MIVAEESVGAREEASQPAASLPKHVAKDLLQGTSALGLGMIIERGCGFSANILAARLGGAPVFGAYALAISTANNISSYAAGGIGSTAIRFSGKHPQSSTSYRTLCRVLLIISLVSAVFAAAVLWLGAEPIAHLLRKNNIVSLLRWAALSAAGMILLECCRGFLVGQRRIPAILLLSSFAGFGMLALVPAASRFGAVPMVASQAAVAIGAATLCVLLARQLGLSSRAPARDRQPIGPLLREIWSFGLVQLAGLVALNAAGWWLTTLVARADASLVQMGFFAVAHQLRNIVALAPALLTESSLAVMAHHEDGVEKTPDQVMATCTFLTTFAALALAGAGLVLLPWGLTLLYGHSYGAASAATALALATAVVHMASSPASARLSIVSIRTTGVVNTAWAMLVALGATSFLFWGGSAARGALVYLVSHLFSAIVIFAFLNRRAHVPRGMNTTFAVGALAGLCMAALALARIARPEWASPATALLTTVWVAALLFLFLFGRRHHWIPEPAALARMLQSKLPWQLGRQTPATGDGGEFDV